MTGNCRDCRWWEPQRKDNYDEIRPGWQVCRLLSVPQRDADGVQDWSNPDAKAEPTNCCGYYSDFTTAPDFGCVQFAALEAFDATGGPT